MKLKTNAFKADNIVLLLITIVYFLFTLNIHQWEAYWYASGIEGLFNITNIHKLFRPHVNSNFDLNIYHPNHPLLHFFVSWFQTLIPSFRSIDIIQYINIAFSIFGLYFFKKSLRLIGFNSYRSSLGLLLLATSNLFWYYSHSSEVYSAPISMLLVSFYYILKIDLSSRVKNTDLIFMTLSFVVSVCFHLMSSFFFLVIIYLSFGIYQRCSRKEFLFSTLTFSSISVLFASTFYGLFVFKYVGVKNLEEYLDSIFILSLASGWLNSYTNNIFLQIIDLIGWKIDSLFNSLIYGESFIIFLFKLLISLCFILSLFYNLKKNESSFKVLLVWALTYFIIFSFVLTIPFNDYWIFFAPAFYIIILKVLDTKFSNYTHYVVIFLISCQLGFNFLNDIFPKSKASLETFTLLTPLKKELVSSDKVIFIFNGGHERFFNELWFVNYYLKNKDVIVLKNEDLSTHSVDDLITKRLNIDLSSQNLCNTIFISVPETKKGYDKSISKLNHLYQSTPSVESELNNLFLKQLTDKIMNQGCEKKRVLLSRRESYKLQKLAQYPAWYDFKDTLLFHLEVVKFSGRGIN